MFGLSLATVFGVVGWAAAVLVAVTVHELGHALAALLSGQRLRAVQIGSGTRLLSAVCRGTTLSLHLFPFGGLTLATLPPHAGWIRLRHWVFAAGGPAANLIVFFAIRGFAASPEPWYAPLDGWMGVDQVNLWSGLLNLVPWRTTRGFASDGRELITLPFTSRQRVEEMLILARVSEVLDARDAGDQPLAASLAERLSAEFPDQGLAAVMPGHVLNQFHQHEAARTVWLAALAGANPSATGALKNALAFVNAVLGGEQRTREADRLSAEAVAEHPGHLHAWHTRGAVLVRLGQMQEGLTLLEAMPPIMLRRTDAAHHHAFVAMALAGLGRPGAAWQQLRLARQADADCTLIAEAEAALRQRPHQQLVTDPVPADEAASVDADRLQRWHSTVRWLAFVLVIALTAACGSPGLLGPVMLAVVLYVRPERSGVLALGASLLSLAVMETLGLGRSAGLGGIQGVLLPLVAAGICIAVSRWRNHLNASSGPVRAIMVTLIGLLCLTFGVLLARAAIRSPLGPVRVISTFVQFSTALVAFATILFAARRRWVAIAGLVPATLAVFLMVISYGADAR